MVGGLGILMEQMVKLRAGGEGERSKPQRQHETGNGKPSGFALTLRCVPNHHANCKKHQNAADASRIYNFSGSPSNWATRANNRPSAPPSRTRWSKLSVKFASITGTNWPLASSQLGTLRPAAMPSTRA